MRKHHNKLYYGKYRYKTVFKMPGSLMFYPTTDQYLTNLKEKNVGLRDLNNLADFIMQHRNSMRFRMQDQKAIFYTNEGMSKDLDRIIHRLPCQNRDCGSEVWPARKGLCGV